MKYGGIGRDLEIRDGQIGKCHGYEGDCNFIIGKEYTLILYIWILDDTSTGESRILVSEFWCHQVGPPAPMVKISMISTRFEVRVTRCHSNWPNPLVPQHSSTMLSQKLDGQEPKTLEVEDAGASASVGSWLLCGC